MRFDKICFRVFDNPPVSVINIGALLSCVSSGAHYSLLLYRTGDLHEIEILAACFVGCGTDGYQCVRAGADRDQIQPRGGEGYAEGQGRRSIQRAGRKATNGRVKVEVYPNSTLYKDKEEMEALQLGAVQMLAPSLAKFGPLGVKEFEVFALPYIFPSKEVLYRVTEGPVGKDLFKKLEPKGITGLAYWDNGFKVMSANKPLHVPADFRGLKMRIQSSKVLDAQMRALGANPQVMAFSEVYQALQTGVVDGTENPPSNLYTQKMHEVQKHVTVSNHGYLGYAVIVNKKFWDGLPADIRTALDISMKEATKYANAIAQQENDQALEAVKKSG